MEFQPIGGFPPFARKTTSTKLNQSKPRGFDTNVASISDIITNKNENLFISLKDSDDDKLTTSDYFSRYYSEAPNEYTSYSF